jgi:hypothetical protein
VAELDPTQGAVLSFVFTECQARLDGDDLLVLVPGARCRAASAAGWLEAVEPGADEIRIDCEPGERSRSDGSEYATAPAYAEATPFRFTGAVAYGRVLTPDGWVLHVSGAVLSLGGLPAEWLDCEAVLIEQGGEQGGERPPGRTGSSSGISNARVLRDGNGIGPLNGPHLPYP